MAKQTQHFLNISKYLLERLSYLKLKLDAIRCEGFSEVSTNTLQQMYPEAKINSENSVELILAVGEISEVQIEQWKNCLKPDGTLLVGLVNEDLDIRSAGDFFISLGFIDVVTDKEQEAVYCYAKLPKFASVLLTEIRRN